MLKKCLFCKLLGLKRVLEIHVCLCVGDDKHMSNSRNDF